jgi:putative transposase
MTEKKARKRANPQDYMPEAEEVARELSKAESMDDFFGKEGIFARLFANTLEQMLEEELTDQLGYEPYEVKGRNSGNSRNGHYSKKVRTSEGDTRIQVPRDRNGDYEPKVL